MKKVLFFDAGNTNTKIALADEKGVGEGYVLPTRPANTADDWGLKITSILEREGVSPLEISSVAVSSVVPPLDPLLARMSRRYFGCDARFAGRDLPLDIENGYARPEEVGADVLVTALAAKRRCGERSMVVVDFGTATTLACVQDGVFLGGLICPGLLSSAASLHSGTAKLPPVRLELESDKLVWGRSTAQCLSQGLVHGFACMVEGLVVRLAEPLGEKPHVVATGGLAEVVARVCPTIREVRPDLLMEGLWEAVFRPTM